MPNTVDIVVQKAFKKVATFKAFLSYLWKNKAFTQYFTFGSQYLTDFIYDVLSMIVSCCSLFKLS